MANHTNPHGGPYASKDPVLYTELNALIDALIKSPNFDEGSAHAPTADIELSGSMGGGFAFADLFPFYGDVDVTNGLIFDAAVSGFARFTERVSVDVFSTLTIKAASGGEGPGNFTAETGTTSTWNSGATASFASGSTTNLTGTVNFRGTVHFRSTANGGPAQVNFETDTLLQVSAGGSFWIYTSDARVRNGATVLWESGSTSTWNSGSEVNFAGVVDFNGTSDIDFESGALVEFKSGSALTLEAGATWALVGGVTFQSGTYPLLSSRSWKRRATHVASASQTSGFGTPDLVAVPDPTTAVPTFLTRPITTGGDISTLEFDPPPHGATMTQVVIETDGTTTVAPTPYPTYRIVRWRSGTAAYETMSSTTTDAHDGTGDWGSNPRSTTLTVTSLGTIDREYRYGLRVTHPYESPSGAQMRVFDCYAEGTMTSLQQ